MQRPPFIWSVLDHALCLLAINQFPGLTDPAAIGQTASEGGAERLAAPDPLLVNWHERHVMLHRADCIQDAHRVANKSISSPTGVQVVQGVRRVQGEEPE